MNDRLPGLEKVHRLGVTFDFILVNAVWMHVPPAARQRAFRKLITLLKPGGRLAISFRQPDLQAGSATRTSPDRRRFARAN
jgi:SAM-dependent methyltransferase